MSSGGYWSATCFKRPTSKGPPLIRSVGVETERAPTHPQISTEANAIRVWLTDAEGLTSRNQPLDGFEVVGKDGHFVPATAKKSK